jgi:hypothetical protein
MSVAVNVGLVGEVGVAGELLLQPTAMSESANVTIDSLTIDIRFMHPTPSSREETFKETQDPQEPKLKRTFS